MDKQKIVDRVIVELQKDIATGDYTVLDELLNLIPINNLIESLPEEEWAKFKK